jgi:hypothetical protein
MGKFFVIAVAIAVAILTVVLPFDRARAQNQNQNQKRIALVVGNSNYANVPKLPNPSRDAISVGQMFRDAGFNNVDVIINATNIELKRAIRKFEIDADQADIAVIFYAGHGLEIGGNNYLIPIDARLASDRDADDEAITLDRVVASADGASKLRLIMLDACRDNPFTSLMRRDRKGSNRVVSAGLGKAEPTSTDTLIAYAAKAGSTAEDGEGQHSPFTSAILRHLTNPGLDIRLAFGRVRDEVMRATGSRQEPFVYGSLGGGNISLVPAPKVQDTPIADVKADYELVARIGTLRAWEVFLGTHKTGFYADLARVQIAALSEQQQQQAGASITRSKGNSDMVVAGVPSAPQPSGRESSSQEAVDWNKIKDSSDPVAFEKFIQKYPDAPLAVTAQQRLEILKQAAAEREAARRAAEKAAEEARFEAERKKAEIAAAKKREEEERLAARKREEDERRAKAAEAEQKAKAAEAERLAAKQRDEEERRARAAEAEQKARAAEAERLAAKQREEEERRAKAAEAEQKAKAAEAERKAAEARQKAEEAERNKAAAEAAAARAESERQARQAEAERKKAEQTSALEAVCKAEQAKFDDLSAKGSDGAGVQNMAAFAKAVTCDRVRPQVTATLNKFYTEAACKTEQSKFDDLSAKGIDGIQNMAAFAKTVTCERIRPQVTATLNRFYTETCKAEQSKFDDLKAKGSEGAGVQNMGAFAKTVTCDALRPQVVAAVDRFGAEAARRAATAPNAPQLVLAAQTQLVRLGCTLPGKPDGIVNAATKTALGRFASLKGRASDNTTVTEALVSELTKQTDRVCPLECRTGEVAKGEKCVAQEKPAAPAATSRKKDNDDDDVPVRRKPQPEKRQAEKEQRRPAPAPAAEPRARQQAIARPSGGGGGGGGGGGHTMIGVGF